VLPSQMEMEIILLIDRSDFEFHFERETWPFGW
jgi:hypothetical protein